MADFGNTGHFLFITIISLQFFMVGFGGYDIQPQFSEVAPDEIVTSDSVGGTQLELSNEVVSQSSSEENIFAVAADTIGDKVPSIIGFLSALPFLLVDIGNYLNFPNSIMLIVYALNIFELIYASLFAVTLFNTLLGGGSGGFTP